MHLIPKKTYLAHSHEHVPLAICLFQFDFFCHFHLIHKFYQAAKKSQRYYHGNEVISQLDETEKLNEVEKSGQKQDNAEGNSDSRLSFSDFSKFLLTKNV